MAHLRLTSLTTNMRLTKALIYVSLFGLTLMCQLFSSKAAVAKASLFLTEDVLFITSEQQVTSVDVINRGSKTGVFAVRWLDHEMQADGRLERIKTGQPAHSLVPWVRFSPRRVTLRPGQSQKIKIALKRNAFTQHPKEYYSHLNVTTLNDDLEATLAQHKQNSPDSGMQIKAKIGISIPVIWRHNVQLAKPSMLWTSKNPQDFIVTVTKQGESSIRAYVHVFNYAQEPKAVAGPYPVVMYPNVQSRDVKLKPEHIAGEMLKLVLSESIHPNHALTTKLAELALTP